MCMFILASAPESLFFPVLYGTLRRITCSRTDFGGFGDQMPINKMSNVVKDNLSAGGQIAKADIFLTTSEVHAYGVALAQGDCTSKSNAVGFHIKRELVRNTHEAGDRKVGTVIRVFAQIAVKSLGLAIHDQPRQAVGSPTRSSSRA